MERVRDKGNIGNALGHAHCHRICRKTFRLWRVQWYSGTNEQEQPRSLIYYLKSYIDILT